MRSFSQPERTRSLPINEATRPDPWAMPAKRDHEPDGSGWKDPSGLGFFVDLNDQERMFVKPTNQQLILLAAAQIHGGGALVSKEARYIGQDTVKTNTQLLRSGKAAEVASTVVVFGVSYEELADTVKQMHEQTLLYHGVKNPQPNHTETIIFHT